MIQSADNRAEATARLEEFMKTSALSRPPQRSRRWLVAGLAGCILLGLGAAAATRPAPLLAGAKPGPAVLDNVWEQLLLAKRANTEETWEAVLKHPGADPHYHHNLAKEGLAYYYLVRSEQDDKYEKAIPHLQQLADSRDPKFQAFGLAGLVVAYAKLGDIGEADRANSQLTPEMRDDLRQQSPLMAVLLETTEQNF
jgi:hypothetical protein